MRASVRIVAAWLAVALGATACTGGDDPDAIDPECRIEVAESRKGDVPAAVDGLAPDDVWVVGTHYEGGAGIPYANRWDGEAWDAASIEVVEEANSGFHDVAAVSGEEAWAVGNLRAREPIVQRFDGSAWQDVTVPSTGFEAAELLGVTAPDASTVTAVGRALDGGRWRTLVMDWDGTSWAVVDAPTPRAADATLRGVDASGAADAWAVGWSVARGGRHRTLALRSDGTSWTAVATPNPGGGDHLLSAVVSLDVDDAWAVGWSIDGDSGDRPLVLRWDGSEWTGVPLPAIGGRVQLIDVAASGPNDVWIAGRATDETQTFASLLLRWDGRAWRRVPTPDVGADDDTLAGVAVTDGAPWGVGTSVDLEGSYTSLVLSGC
jgi:hypothetical protein